MIGVIYGAETYGLLEQHSLALEGNIRSMHMRMHADMVHSCLTSSSWLAPFSPEVRSDIKDLVMKTLLMETALIHLQEEIQTLQCNFLYLWPVKVTEIAFLD